MQKPMMAICYDFDGTLSTSPMQENKSLPSVGVSPDVFWSEVNAISKRDHADNILIYMMLMLQKAHSADEPITRKVFRDKGEGMTFWDGVDTWFDRVNDYARRARVDIRHYVISSGNEEIIQGTSIAGRFDRIFACRFHFDSNGVADWPAVAVNYTTKTQFLFRINKGCLDMDDDGVNDYVPDDERPIPFSNIVYIGDGETDVPCFRTVRSLGGLSIGVYPPHRRGGKETVRRLLSDGRIDTYCPADYREGKQLESIVCSAIDEVGDPVTVGGPLPAVCSAARR